MKTIITTILAATITTTALADVPKSYSEARRKLDKIYNGREETFYCKCKYYFNEGSKTPNLSTCDYKPRKPSARSSRVEWEHVVPASILANNLPCWQKGGRKQCTKDYRYNAIVNDLHNLVPAIGELNQDRSNYHFSYIVGEKRNYGKCDFEVSVKDKIVEPPEEVRGDIARIWLYMTDRYSLNIPYNYRLQLVQWSKLDPVSWDEIVRDQRIFFAQGNGNPYVTGH